MILQGYIPRNPECGKFYRQMTHVFQRVGCQDLDHFSVIFAEQC